MGPHSSSSPTTPTPPETESAHTTSPRVSPPSLPTPTSKPTPLTNLRLPSTRPQSPLPSRPIKLPSNTTPRESSLRDVDNNSTTVSSPSDTEPSTEPTSYSSRTPGVTHGEIRDTLESPLTRPTNAVSSPTHHTQLSEILACTSYPIDLIF